MSLPISLPLYPSQFILPIPPPLFVVHLHIKVITILLRHWDQDQISLRLHPTLSDDPATYIIRSLEARSARRCRHRVSGRHQQKKVGVGGLRGPISVRLRAHHSLPGNSYIYIISSFFVSGEKYETAFSF